MATLGPSSGDLTGSILVAHPALLDPNFRRTVLFLSHHSVEDGAIGLVLNRPLGQRFADLKRPGSSRELDQVELFYGGPVGSEHVTLASLQWRENPSSIAFHSFMGQIESVEIEPEWRPGLRAFVGYAGWSEGQLENEIAQKAWLVLSPNQTLVEMEDPENAWREIMRHSGPLLRLLAEAPDDPERN